MERPTWRISSYDDIMTIVGIILMVGVLCLIVLTY